MNEKVSYFDLTILIPVRIDSSYRKWNLLSVLNFYKNLTGISFIVLEADSTQKITNEINGINNINYLYIKDDNEIFHRTHYINEMLTQVETKYAAIWDTDAIAPYKQLHNALEILRNNAKFIISYPYDGCFWSVNNYFSKRFHEILDITILTEFPQCRHLMCGYRSVGGAFIVNVKNYWNIGAENEHFIGWGPEDAERFKRCEILTEKPKRIKGSLFHLWHPRGLNSGDFNKDLAISTKKEYCNVCSMSKEQLTKYINSWKWVKEYLKK